MLRRAVLVIAVAGRAAAAAPDALVLGDGQLRADVTAEVNMSSGLVGHPTSLAPDVWYGVLPALTVGLIHSDQSLDRIGPGASFCVVTDPVVCPDHYRGTGIDGLYSLTAGSFAAAAHARLLLFELPLDGMPSRFIPAITLGAAMRWHRGRWSIDGDPYLQLGLANRAYGNRAQLWLPVVFAVRPIPRVALELHTGWNSALAVASDGYNVPAGIGVHARALWNVDVGALFGFESILGPQNDVKNRVLFIGVSWRS